MSQTPEEIARERIQKAAESGANELDLSALGLKSLPPEIGQLANITSLNLSGNELTSLPQEIVQLQALAELNLLSNQLTRLPKEVSRLQAITQLDLSFNQLASLPQEIIQLKNLIHLDLSYNQLSSLQSEISQLQNLLKLKLSFNRLVSLPAEIGQLQNLTKLDLQNNQLTNLIPEVSQLQNLTDLLLSGNQLTNLLSEIIQLQNLKQLDLSDNQLTSLPPEIGQLTNLTQLWLSSNKLVSLPPEIEQLTNLTQLNLSGNQFTKFLPEIGKLLNLKELSVSSNQILSLPFQIGQLSNLTKLEVGGNKLTRLPPEIGQLTNLTELNLDNNQLASLPPEIGQLINLIQLDLSSNQLTNLPPEIGQLKNLSFMFIYRNPLSNLPPEIGQISSLVHLTIWGNKLSSLPSEIGKLQKLKYLDLWSNQLTSLPPEIGQLKELTKLDLADNQLSLIPTELSMLYDGLKELYISNNPLSNIPNWIWQKKNWEKLELRNLNIKTLQSDFLEFTELDTLVLSENQLTSLPPEIFQLEKLRQFDLRNNQLTSLPLEIGQLQNLTSLDLRNNQLANLPKEIVDLVGLEYINLHDNPLAIAIPAELLGSADFGGDAQRIFGFYKILWEAGGRPLGEARVLVVGQPQVGKSSLVERLVHGTYTPNRDSTITVEMHTLPSGENTALVWDFGGQEHMHSTHPFFFSARCVYLLVINVRDTEEQNRLEYWLRTISLYGKDSPIILVGNKADKDQHTLDIPIKRLKKEYPNLRIAVETSAQDDMGIEELRAAIIKQVDSLPQVRVELPVSYLAIKEAMDAEKQRKNIISLERFVELCEENEIKDKRDQDNLLALLHDLGTIFHFKDEDGQAISEVGILNPNWVTNGVYRVINSEQVRKETKGKLTLEMVHQILPANEYLHHHCRLIVDLMKRFELCFQADDTTFWLPNLMDKSEPDTGSWDSALTFEYEYPELPENVITRFIVRTHSWIYSDHVWRTGIHLEKDGNQALVRANLYTKRLTIQVNGRENTRRDLLSFLRGHFDEIHKPFDPKPKAYIYPKEYPDVQISFDDLLLYEGNRRDKITVTAKGGVMDLSVRELLNGFIDLTERDKERRTRDGEMPDFVDKAGPKEIHYHQHNHVDVSGDVSGNIIIGEKNKIDQTISNANITPELKETLLQLNEAVSMILSFLPQESAEETQEDLKKLVEEASKPKPNKRWYSVSIEGLIKAAENLNDLGKPVISLAGKVLKLLSPLP